MHNPIKHILIPAFGVIANFLCMLFYLVGPFMVPGMSKKEPYFALVFCAIWGIFGAIYFLTKSKSMGREVLLTKPTSSATV
jgi:hypothetical protein